MGVVRAMGFRSASASLLLMVVGGCDGVARARIQVLSAEGASIPDALVILEGSPDHDLARYTDSRGCAYFSGTVAPVRQVPIAIGKAGYRQERFQLSTIQENCLVVRLAREGGPKKGAVETLALDDCPCDSGSGYSPKMAARFIVRSGDASPVADVALRQSDKPRYPWKQTTDEHGCLGVTWIVPASRDDIPLVLEHQAFNSAEVFVPTRGDHCYAVRLARSGSGQASTVVEVPADACECAMFSGQNAFE